MSQARLGGGSELVNPLFEMRGVPQHELEVAEGVRQQACSVQPLQEMQGAIGGLSACVHQTELFYPEHLRRMRYCDAGSV